MFVITKENLVTQYINEELSFYHLYEVYMKEQEVDESILSFRIWKKNYQTSSYLPILKNHFFLETFVLTFIQ